MSDGTEKPLRTRAEIEAAVQEHVEAERIARESGGAQGPIREVIEFRVASALRWVLRDGEDEP